MIVHIHLGEMQGSGGEALVSSNVLCCDVMHSLREMRLCTHSVMECSASLNAIG